MTLLTLAAGLGAAGLLLFAPLFDRGVIPGNFPLILSILLVQLACLLAKGALGAGAFHLFSAYGADLAATLTLRVYHHLQRQSFTYQLDKGQSELLQLLRGDTAIIEGGFSQLAGQALVAGLQILIVLALLLAWYPGLFWLGLAGLAGTGVLACAASRVSEKALAREIQENVRVGEHLLKTLGVRGFLLQVSAWGEWGGAALRTLLADYTQTLRRRRTRPNWLMEAGQGWGYAALFILYLLGGYWVTAGKMSIGGLVSLAALFTYLSSGAQQLGASMVGLRDGLLRLQRLQGELACSRELPEPADPAAVASVRGAYAFRTVNFSYPGSDLPALKGLTLRIPPGRVTVLIGRSGSGKTTLGYLMLRFFDPDAGSIHLDDLPLQHFSARELWGKIGYVPQEPIFFRGSIRDNLLLGRPATDEDLARACRAAAIYDQILKAGGWDAQLAEIGYSLSGGERQRLAVARALVPAPPILILDEPTAHLDKVNAQAIWSIIREIATSGKMVLIITHRLPPGLAADNLAVLDAGRLVAWGPLDGLSPAAPEDQELLRELGCHP